MFFHMVYKSGQIFLPFCHNPRVWRTDRQTDGRTDGQTDRQNSHIAIPRLHYMQRGKNTLLAILMLRPYGRSTRLRKGRIYDTNSITNRFFDTSFWHNVQNVLSRFL